MDKDDHFIIADNHPLLLQLIEQLLDKGLSPKLVARRYATQYPNLSDQIEGAARHIMENKDKCHLTT